MIETNLRPKRYTSRDRGRYLDHRYPYVHYPFNRVRHARDRITFVVTYETPRAVRQMARHSLTTLFAWRPLKSSNLTSTKSFELGSTGWTPEFEI